MNRKQYSLIVVLALVAGLVGGVFSSQYFIGVPVFAQKTSQDVIKAKEFRLLDNQGRTRAALGTHEQGVVFGMTDNNGILRVALEIANDGDPQLALFDKKQKRRVGIALDADAMDAPGLTFFDGSETGRASLKLMGHGGAPLLTLSDKGGKERMSLALDPRANEAPFLSLCDKSEVARTSLMLRNNGVPFLKLFDDKGRCCFVLATGHGTSEIGITDKDYNLRVHVLVGADGTPQITLMDKKRNIIWSAP